MPVIAERINKPTEQDLIDLSKTYEGNIEWLQPILESDDLVIGGRFNDRLVAAFVLCRQGDLWRLDKLQVREITRRRGVARQTLHSALNTLSIDGPVCVDLSAHPELSSLFESLGFSAQPNAKGLMQWQA